MIYLFFDKIIKLIIILIIIIKIIIIIIIIIIIKRRIIIFIIVLKPCFETCSKIPWHLPVQDACKHRTRDSQMNNVWVTNDVLEVVEKITCSSDKKECV